MMGSGGNPMMGSGGNPMMGSGGNPIMGSGSNPMMGSGGNPMMGGNVMTEGHSAPSSGPMTPRREDGSKKEQEEGEPGSKEAEKTGSSGPSHFDYGEMQILASKQIAKAMLMQAK